MFTKRTFPVLQAISAALLFGANAPFAKLLLGEIEAVPLAAFLYLGSGFGLLIFRSLLTAFSPYERTEAPLEKNDLPWLIGAILAGGVLAPILLLFSLRHTAASTASLLLNCEGMATVLIAALTFQEAISKRIWAAIVCITGASILVSISSGGAWGISLGAIGVMGACILWGVDNNLTRNISIKDPITIVIFKGIGAGSFSLLLAYCFDIPLPNLSVIFNAMLLGSISYGISIVLFIMAMRNLGSARTSAFFGVAPFVGVLLSFLILRETPNALFLISVPLMIMGIFLLLGEQHAHKHSHSPALHEHPHDHTDDHHAHFHSVEALIPNKTHSHLHTHESLEHIHAHNPDIHHRHGHTQEQ